MPEEHAEELGIAERGGKLQIPALVWVFVFGFAVGGILTLQRREEVEDGASY
jgi:hypothetical protein